MWRHHETWDGTYTLDDLCEINLALDIRDENERRARQASRKSDSA